MPVFGLYVCIIAHPAKFVKGFLKKYFQSGSLKPEVGVYLPAESLVEKLRVKQAVCKAEAVLLAEIFRQGEALLSPRKPS